MPRQAFLNSIIEGRGLIMAEKWYPVINYENCIECGACIEKCKHGVYAAYTVKPKVVNPDGCIDGCRGCQRLCSVEAIGCVGDMSRISLGLDWCCWVGSCV